MAEDLEVEAKEAALREVAKLLPRPELLESISSIKADYIGHQPANDEQLSAMLTEQVEQAEAGLEFLSSSKQTIDQLRENFRSIERLSQESQNLIDNNDQIKLLSNVRNNLNTTLKDVEGMMSIFVEAAEAPYSLSDPKELVNTYEIYENSLGDGKIPPKAGFLFPRVKCLTDSKGSIWSKLT